MMRSRELDNSSAPYSHRYFIYVSVLFKSVRISFKSVYVIFEFEQSQCQYL